MTLELPEGCVAVVRMPYECGRLVKLMNNLGQEHGDALMLNSYDEGRWMMFVMPVAEEPKTETAGRSACITGEEKR